VPGDRQDPRVVEPAAVIGPFDDDRAAAMLGADVDRAVRRLARGHPIGGQLDAVIDAVAHDVDQRIVSPRRDRRQYKFCALQRTPVVSDVALKS